MISVFHRGAMGKLCRYEVEGFGTHEAAISWVEFELGEQKDAFWKKPILAMIQGGKK